MPNAKGEEIVAYLNVLKQLCDEHLRDTPAPRATPFRNFPPTYPADIKQAHQAAAG